LDCLAVPLLVPLALVLPELRRLVPAYLNTRIPKQRLLNGSAAKLADHELLETTPESMFGFRSALLTM
jgi:hypothetical protein